MFGYRAHFEHGRAQNNYLSSNKVFILTPDLIYESSVKFEHAGTVIRL